jgi:hypothetical protein
VIEVPTFVKGEPGFAAKLNQLADAVRELQQGSSDLSEMTLPDLRAHAEANNIDLGDATRKADIVAKIRASE